MSTSTDKSYHYKTIRKTCYSANIIYLVIRLFYLILFIVSKLYILVYINAALILVYLSFFFVIKKRKYYLYALLCGNEFFAFIIVSTILLGFDSGYAFYLIGLCIVSFFTTYFSKTRNIKGSVVWVGLSLAIFLSLYFGMKFNAPYYVIDRWLEMTLFTTHIVLAFAFVATYMVVILKYAMSLENKIMNESRTDELTQISNRYGLYDYYEQEEDKSNVTLALFDIDNFKNINDTYGHVVGDHILKRVAKITTEVLNDSFVCRYGGEEFVIMTKNDGHVSPKNKMEILRTTIEKEPFDVNGVIINITITIGAVDNFKDLSLEKWVELADKKMYAGKNAGKNQVVY